MEYFSLKNIHYIKDTYTGLIPDVYLANITPHFSTFNLMHALVVQHTGAAIFLNQLPPSRYPDMYSC